MKKFVLIFLVFLMAFSAYAEDVDCSALSDEELLKLLLEVSEEIDARGLEAAEIKDGRYTAGTDIKSGKWEISSSDKGIGMTSIRIYDSKDDTKEMFSYSIKGRGTCYVSLEKGMVLELTSIGSHKCYIKEVENFFAP